MTTAANLLARAFATMASGDDVAGTLSAVAPHDRKNLRPKTPGARTSGAARTRLIDDWTCEAVRDGLQQVVIVGAGFDCRALRLKQLHAVSLFELDRREMLALKSRLLVGAKPSNER
jgi:methyltransferase (TIGR00027 family)